MARGWESKAVEDQVASAEAERSSRAKPRLSADQRQRQSRRDSLLLSRTKLLNDLESAVNECYRAMLERALAHLDKELQEVE
jgi:hypothetical protein